jgi:hypothetical protein
MTQTTFAPGTVIANRNRLWRVDAQAGDVLIATPIDGGETEPQPFYIPLENIRPGRLEPPSPEIVGHPSSQDLLLPYRAPQGRGAVWGRCAVGPGGWCWRIMHDSDFDTDTRIRGTAWRGNLCIRGSNPC